MEFNVTTYNITEGDTYYSIAKKLTLNDQEYREYGHKDYFVKAVEAGLKCVLRNKKLVVGESIKVIDNVQYYINITFASSAGTKKGTNTINNITTFGETLYFNIREYKEYSNYNWREDAENGEILRGEMGQEVEGYNGDKLNNIKDKNGYIYVFDAENNLKYCFELKDGLYQEFKIANGLCSFNTPKGAKAEYATIKRFITDNPEDEHHECKFVFSKVKLSAQRLKGDEANGIPKIDPNWFYRQVPILKYEYLGLQGELKPGVMLLRDYRNDNEMPTLATYHLFSESFGSKEGISIYYPDPLKELTRRAKIFQKRYEDKYNWESSKSLTQQLFLYTTVKTLIEKDSGLERYADTERMNLWYEAYTNDLVRYTRKVQNAANHLIKWLESHILHHTLLNYFSSDDKDSLLSTLEAYNKSLIYLDQCQVGRSFYKRQVKNADSFVNTILDLNSASSTNKSAIDILLKEAFINQDVQSARAFTLRKLQQAIFDFASKFVPAIMLVREKKAIEKLTSKLTKLSTGGTGILKQIPIEPIRNIQKKVDVFDLDALERSVSGKLNNKYAAGVIGFVEVVNIYYSIKILVEDPKHKERNAAALCGAVLDFTAGVASNKHSQSWLLKAASRNVFVKASVGRVIKAVPVLCCISGAIDFFVGADSAWEAYQDGEMGLATGYALFSVGGALCAVGAGAIILGGETAVVSLGFGAIPAGVLVIGGIILEGIGLAIAWYWDNRDVKDWIEESIFGDQISYLKENFSNIFNLNNKELVMEVFKSENKSTLAEISNSQIETINNIMCDFNVEASFDDYGGSTKVTVEIEPGLITERSSIRFTDMKAYAEARFAEYFQPSVDRNDLSMGMAGSTNPTINIADKINNAKVIEKDGNGKIIKITEVFYYNMDIDRIKGNITLDLNTGTLQGLTKVLDESAAFYE